VFDFDGVLANSEPIHLEAIRAALRTRGWDVPPEDYYARFLGYNDEDALDAMAAAYGWPLSREGKAELIGVKLEHSERLLASPGVLYPGAAACVRALAGDVPLAIASGATRAEIDIVLGTHALASAFRAIVAAGDTARGKPAPDPYARAVELLQETGALPRGNGVASRCVAIEDSRWGIRSARDAGLRCVAVTTSYPAEELSEADLVVDRIEQITSARLGALVGAPA
jgi:HAD superfamily hydrolase (TIGR01509 family)